MKKIKLINISLFILFCFTITAQNLPSDIKSPTAAAFEKYGDIPVSYGNGSVDISVPVYSSSSSRFQLNLALQYDTSGLVLRDGPGIVGTNWSMSGIGSISRTVNSEPDEKWVENFPEIIQPNFYSYYVLNNTDIETDEGLEDLFQNHFGEYGEMEPDIFTFNFLGKTGKFLMGSDGLWKVQSESNLDIIIDENDFILPFGIGYEVNPDPGPTAFPIPVKTIGKITIKDDQGYTYVFGSSPESIEYSGASFFNQQAKRLVPSTWYLNSVIDRFGKILCTYTYIRGTPIASFYTYVERQDSVYFWDHVSGSLISPVYLSSIVTNNETLTFSYSDTNCLSFQNEPALSNKFYQTLSYAPGGAQNFTLYTTNYLQHTTSSYTDWNTFIAPMKWKNLQR